MTERPAVDWLADWDALVRARDPDAPGPVAMPLVDGVPIVERMDMVGVACRVPAPLLDDFAR